MDRPFDFSRTTDRPRNSRFQIWKFQPGDGQTIRFFLDDRQTKKFQISNLKIPGKKGKTFVTFLLFLFFNFLYFFISMHYQPRVMPNWRYGRNTTSKQKTKRTRIRTHKTKQSKTKNKSKLPRRQFEHEQRRCQFRKRPRQTKRKFIQIQKTTNEPKFYWCLSG